MKNIYLLIVLLLATTVNAQENSTDSTSVIHKSKTYKVKKNSGKLQINLGKVTVEGYNGNEIIFSLENSDEEEDKRAEGLQVVNALGLKDNTGLGINLAERDGVLEVNALKKISHPEIIIRVPQNIIIAFKHQSQYGGDVIFRNLQNEVEIATTYNKIELENITGPATVKSIYGDIDAIFTQDVKGPLSIISIYGHADVTLPKAIKTNLKASTTYGEIYMSPDIEVTVEGKNGDNDLVGKINGGGFETKISSDYGKIYLRAK